MKAWKEFILPYNGEIPGEMKNSWPYQPYTDVNFISLPGDTATLSVKVMATGPVKAYDRIFLVEVNPDSTDLTENVGYLPLNPVKV